MNYAFTGADDNEQERLRLLGRIYDQNSLEQIDQFDWEPDSSALELGAGAGSLLTPISIRVGPYGTVTAVDLDTSQISAAMLRDFGRVRIIEGDVLTVDLPLAPFDLIHGRMIVSHMGQPERMLRRCCQLGCNGTIVVLEELRRSRAKIVRDGVYFEEVRQAVKTLVSTSSSYNADFGEQLVTWLEQFGCGGIVSYHEFKVESSSPADPIRQVHRLLIYRFADMLLRQGLTTPKILRTALAELDSEELVFSASSMVTACFRLTNIEAKML